jgi:signal transduction histidine kinase
LVICRDLTEHKRTEERLRQSQKMEAIGHLAGGMAHEFNNILAAMMLNLSLARMGDRGTDQQQMLDDLEEGCKRSANLIKQLLAFSRQSVMSQRTLNLGGIVAGQAKSLKPFLDGRCLDYTARLHLVEQANSSGRVSDGKQAQFPAALVSRPDC